MSKTRVEITLHPGARIKGDRDKLTAVVLALYREHGSLTPNLLIKAARPRNNPLHDEFTWDADQALTEVQRSQALYLIRVISLEITEVDTGHVYRGREFVLNPVDTDGDEYVSVRTALSDPEMRQQVIEQLKTRLLLLCDELKAFKEFAGVVEEITAITALRRRKRIAAVRSGSERHSAVL